MGNKSHVMGNAQKKVIKFLFIAVINVRYSNSWGLCPPLITFGLLFILQYIAPKGLTIYVTNYR